MMVCAWPASVLIVATTLNFAQGQQYGYNSVKACIPGYDEDCDGSQVVDPNSGSVVTPGVGPFTNAPGDPVAPVTDAPVDPVAPVTSAPSTPDASTPDASGLNSPSWVGPATGHGTVTNVNGYGTAVVDIHDQPVQNGPSVPTGGGGAIVQPDDSSSGPGATLFPSIVDISTPKPDCSMQIPQLCVFPFKYKDLPYTTCTAVDSSGALWCSTDAVYSGHWKECKDPCKSKWPVKAIVSSVVAGGVAATGIGLIAYAVDHKKKEGTAWNPMGFGWQGSTTAAPGTQHVYVPSALNNAQYVSNPRLLADGFLRKLEAVIPGHVDASMTGTGSVLPFVAIALVVCGCACLFSIAAAVYSGFGKTKEKRVQTVTPA